MGREIKRVAKDFSWPINTVWKGYISPYRATECKACGGSGLNPETKKLEEDWYAFDKHERYAGWCYRLEQEEVQALVDKGRLMDFTHTWEKGKGWNRRKDKYIPTAAEVNEWAKKPFGHDAINRWICVEARAKRLGIYGQCSLCDGDGSYFCSPKYKRLADKWQRIEPPEGDAYQLWETVSEGSPISPTFETAEDLAEWLASQKEGWFDRDNMPKARWLKFILSEHPSAPSMIMMNGVFQSGVEAITDPAPASGREGA